MVERERLLAVYSTSVTLLGGVTLVCALLLGEGPVPESGLAAFGLFTLAVILGELAPIRVRGYAGELAISTTFVFAILLVHGLVPALAVQALGSLVADLHVRKPLRRCLFNVAQYTLSWTAAGLLLFALTDIGSAQHPTYAGSNLPGLFAVCVAFFAVNSVLVRMAVALASGRSIAPHLVSDCAFRAWTTGMLMALAPAIAAVQNLDLALAVLIVLPVVAIHRAARESGRNAHLATHDELTGMPNRALFGASVERAIAGSGGDAVAVMLMDLDRFKEINDTLGHHHGDSLLQQVGPRLQSLIGERGVAARLGGDEFAVLMPLAAGGEAAALREAKRVQQAFDGGFLVDGVLLDVGASIGVAVHPCHGTDVETLMQRADVAMYRAKEAQTGVEIYDKGEDQNTLERLSMAAELRQAIERDELVLHYQPKLDLQDASVLEVEALVRWQHPVRGLIPPNAFVPIAEHTGLVRPITRWVIAEALAQCARWRSDGLDLRVAVNLSTRSLLDGGLPAEVRRQLDLNRLGGGALVLEITESALMADPERSARILENLADMGVSLAIDDFGIGYSSLSYLKRLPVDELKIDRSFVSNLARDPDDALIVRSTVEMARGLRLRVVAEGVEDEVTLNRLRGFGCHLAQGYGISRPLPAPQLALWLRAHRGTSARARSAGTTLTATAAQAV